MSITFTDKKEAREYAKVMMHEGHRVKLSSANKVFKVTLLGTGKLPRETIRVLPQGQRAKIKLGSITPMTAHKASPDILTKIEGDKNLGVSEKFDGYRELLYLGEKKNNLISRSGNNHTSNAPHIQDAIIPEYSGTVLDTEAIAPSNELGDTTSILGSSPSTSIKWQEKHGNLKLIAFDIPRYKGIDITMLPLRERRKYLEETVNALHKAGLKEIRMEKLYFQDKRQVFDDIVKRSGEGVMIKDLTKPYVEGERTRHWLKVKKQDTWDVIIIGFTPGEGKYKDTIGAIRYGAYNKEGKLMEIGRASGMTDEERYAFGKNPKKYIGKVIELSGQEIGTGGAIRHPDFKRMREDKEPQDILLKDIK